MRRCLSPRLRGHEMLGLPLKLGQNAFPLHANALYGLRRNMSTKRKMPDIERFSRDAGDPVAGPALYAAL